MNLERKFLHDISSPLTTLQLNIENVISMMSEADADPAECEKILNTCLRQVGRATEMIRARREALLAEEKK